MKIENGPGKNKKKMNKPTKSSRAEPNRRANAQQLKLDFDCAWDNCDSTTISSSRDDCHAAASNVRESALERIN